MADIALLNIFQNNVNTTSVINEMITLIMVEGAVKKNKFISEKLFIK